MMEQGMGERMVRQDRPMPDYDQSEAPSPGMVKRGAGGGHFLGGAPGVSAGQQPSAADLLAESRLQLARALELIGGPRAEMVQRLTDGQERDRAGVMQLAAELHRMAIDVVGLVERAHEASGAVLDGLVQVQKALGSIDGEPGQGTDSPPFLGPRLLGAAGQLGALFERMRRIRQALGPL